MTYDCRDYVDRWRIERSNRTKPALMILDRHSRTADIRVIRIPRDWRIETHKTTLSESMLDSTNDGTARSRHPERRFNMTQQQRQAQQCAQHFIEGQNAKQIAKALTVTERTVYRIIKRPAFHAVLDALGYTGVRDFIFFFAFDAHRLISEYDALVGPDLVNEYDQIVDSILKETDATIEPKTGMSEADLDRFCEKKGMTDIQHDSIFRKAMMDDSRSHYQDLLSEFNDLSTAGVSVQTSQQQQ